MRTLSGPSPFGLPGLRRPIRTGTLWKAPRNDGQEGVLKKRVQSPGERRRDFREALAPSVKEPPLALRQKVLRPPPPLVAVLMIFPEVGEQGLQLLKFGLVQL